MLPLNFYYLKEVFHSEIIKKDFGKLFFPQFKNGNH